MTEQLHRPKQTPEDGPTDAERRHYETTTSETEKGWWTLRRKVGAAGAALVAAGAFVVGGAVAVGRGGENVEAKAPPAATAPANPADQPGAGAGEVTPTPTAVETVPTGELTPETFPLVTPEGTFEGVEDFRLKNQFLVSDYKDATDTTPGKKNINELIHDFTAHRNAWLNSGMDQSGSNDFTNYSMEYTDIATNTNQVFTGPDAVIHTYDKAYGETFIKDEGSTDTSGGLAARIASTHHEVSRWREHDPSYTATIKITGERGSDPTFHQGPGEIVFQNVVTTYTDSMKNKPGVTVETLKFTQELDNKGHLVWMITHSESEPLEEVSE